MSHIQSIIKNIQNIMRKDAGVDALSDKIRNLQQDQVKTAADLTALEQSVLHKAFNP
jgi:SMC interacting uncharacterized protein involved in chromosome segregation